MALTMKSLEGHYDLRDIDVIAGTAIDVLAREGRVDLPDASYELALEVEDVEEGMFADLYRGKVGDGTQPQPVEIKPVLRRV